jgi:large subunit ribosomal protein L28
MAKKCKVMNKSPMVGNKVSHANNKTKRRFEIALKWVNIFLVIAGVTHKFRIRICQQALRTINKIRRTDGEEAALNFLKRANVI